MDGEVLSNRRFHFEECLVENAECIDLISANWVNNSGLSAIDGVLANIQLCGLRLKDWNRLNRRKLKEEVSRLKSQ